MIDIQRAKAIQELRSKGYSYKTIGQVYGVSRQAVQQQLKKLKS